MDSAKIDQVSNEEIVEAYQNVTEFISFLQKEFKTSTESDTDE